MDAVEYHKLYKQIKQELPQTKQLTFYSVICFELFPIQTHNFERVYLVPTDPEDGCGELTNSLSIVGAFALVKRG